MWLNGGKTNSVKRPNLAEFSPFSPCSESGLDSKTALTGHKLLRFRADFFHNSTIARNESGKPKFGRPPVINQDDKKWPVLCLNPPCPNVLNRQTARGEEGGGLKTKANGKKSSLLDQRNHTNLVSDILFPVLFPLSKRSTPAGKIKRRSLIVSAFWTYLFAETLKSFARHLFLDVCHRYKFSQQRIAGGYKKVGIEYIL